MPSVVNNIIFPALLFGLLPSAACLVFDRYGRYFRGYRASIPILLYSLASWVTINGFIFLKYSLDPMSIRGPEAAFALFFGWLYLWMTSLPVFLLYSAVRIIFRRSAKGISENGPRSPSRCGDAVGKQPFP